MQGKEPAVLCICWRHKSEQTEKLQRGGRVINAFHKGRVKRKTATLKYSWSEVTFISSTLLLGSWHYNNEKHVRMVRFELSVHICWHWWLHGYFCWWNETFYTIKSLFQPFILMFWRALQIILYSYSWLTSESWLTVSHLWGKIMGFFFRRNEKITYSIFIFAHRFWVQCTFSKQV